MKDEKKSLGLKNALCNTKGMRPFYRIKCLFRQIHLAWQRAWDGYEYDDVCNFDWQFFERSAVLLREFKRRNVGLFVEPSTTESPDDWRMLTKDETNAVLDEMIFYAENTDEDVVRCRLFGEGSRCDESTETTRAVLDEAARCRKEFMRLLSKWIDQLWY